MAMSALGEANQSISLGSALGDFRRYVKAQCDQLRLSEQGMFPGLSEIVTARKGASSRLRAMAEIPSTAFEQYKEQPALSKAAVAIGGMDVGWGGALAPYEQAAQAFLGTLAPYSSFDRMLNDGAFYPLPLRTRNAAASSAALGSSVPEQGAKPVTSMSFTSVQNPALKAIGEVVLSDELLRMTVPAADALFALEMQKAVALATDTKFLQIVAAGGGATHASTGLTAAQFLSDLQLALQSIAIDEASERTRLYLVVPLSVWKTLSLLTLPAGDWLMVNNKINNIHCIASSATAHDGYLINAASVGAASDLITTTVSRHASVEMADNPTAGDYHLLSLFQNNLTLIRCERFFGATVMRPTGISAITAMV
jgi:hypothetical protein